MTWETVDDSNGTTDRMVVPGGWLYRSVWRARQSGMMMMDAAGLVFVPEASIGSAEGPVNEPVPATIVEPAAEMPPEPEVAMAESEAPPTEPNPAPPSEPPADAV